MRIILASKSPRRKEILGMIVDKFDIMVCKEDEILDNTLSIKEQSIKLAYDKAKNIFNRTNGDRIVIGSDTIVVDENDKIYGKPQDREDAIKILNSIKGKEHRVFTSIAVLVSKNGKIYEDTDCDIARVYIDNMTDEEVTKWVDTGEAYDKAGAYAVQGRFAKHIEKIDGNFWTVMGLPINKIYNILKKYIGV